MELILGLLILSWLSRTNSSNNRNQKSLKEKWAPVLDYSSNTCPPIPERDKLLVANLYEQSERYCMKNKIYKNPFLGEISQNYKTTTYDFG